MLYKMKVSRRIGPHDFFCIVNAERYRLSRSISDLSIEWFWKKTEKDFIIVNAELNWGRDVDTERYSIYYLEPASELEFLLVTGETSQAYKLGFKKHEM